MAHPSATHGDQQHVQAHRPVRTLAAAVGMSPHDLVPDPRDSRGATAIREVRRPLPWNWDGLDEDAAAESWRRLSAWDGWFVARHDLAQEVPTCWWRYAALADELRAPWYYHQAVTGPLVHVVFPASAPTWPSEEPASPTWRMRSGHAGWT